MKRTAAAVLLPTAAATALTLAPLANAEPLDGPYTVTAAGSPQNWVFAPCGPDCAHLAEVNGRPHNTDLHLANGHWVSQTGQCIDIDASTLAGTLGCAPNSLAIQLAKS